MSLIAIAAGAAGAWGLSNGLFRFGKEPAQPPLLYEYFLDNYWFKSAGFDTQLINPPLKGSRKADIVILGGGFTGLASTGGMLNDGELRRTKNGYTSTKKLR